MKWDGVTQLSVAGLVLALGGCGGQRVGRRESPFTLFGRDDMRAGLPFRTLDESAKNESLRQYQCVPLWGGARRCSLPIETGLLVAIVDSTQHVIRLIAASDSGSRNRYDVHGLLIFRDVVRDTRATWDSVGTLYRDGMDAETPQLRWLDPTHRWGGSLWYSRAHRANVRSSPAAMDAELAISLPESITVTDLPAYSLLMERQPTAPAPKPIASPVRVAVRTPPTRDDLLTMLRSDLRALTIAQEGVVHATGNYETQLERLPFTRSDGVVLQLVHATPDGWGAVATHPSLSGVSCVVFAGNVPTPPLTQREGRRGSPGEVVCDP